ncbi:MAG: DNA glycosylase [Tissierellia bacterium]|nr:DNA glycosylase [Tissierellia bacterium]
MNNTVYNSMIIPWPEVVPDIEATMNSGQCFRWKKIDNGFLLLFGEGSYYLESLEDGLNITIGPGKGSVELLKDFFQWERDYKTLFLKLNKFSELTKPISFGSGLRMLSQPFFETLIGFILSANNNIPRIKGSMNKIANLYGDYYGEWIGEKIYSFPTPEKFSKANPQELREKCGTGFRDIRIVTAAKAVLEKKISELELRSLPLKEARDKLMTLPGVGPKVADCVLLFGLNREEVFPVDTWMEKILIAEVLDESYNRKAITKWGEERYEKLAGIAQQLIFYYAKDSWGKETK